MKESLGLKGKLDIFVTKGAKPSIINGPELPTRAGYPRVYKSAKIDFSQTKIIDEQHIHNIILNLGKDRVIETLTTGFINVIARMAIGDRGTIPSDQTVPKVPTADQTTLFNEVYRDDVDTTTLDVGTPTVHEVTFIKTFSALEVPITAFSNQANPLVNEVALVMADLLGGAPLPRPPVASPDTPDADEELFSTRTFKSVPFEAANEITVTIRYTIFIE